MTELEEKIKKLEDEIKILEIDLSIKKLDLEDAIRGLEYLRNRYALESLKNAVE